MDPLSPVGIFLPFLFIASMILLRFYNQKAYSALSVEDKAKILALPSGFYMRHVLIVVLLLAYAAMTYLNPSILLSNLGLIILVLLLGAWCQRAVKTSQEGADQNQPI